MSLTPLCAQEEQLAASAADGLTLVLSVLVTFNWLTGLPAGESSASRGIVHYLITIIDYIPNNGLLLLYLQKEETSSKNGTWFICTPCSRKCCKLLKQTA